MSELTPALSVSSEAPQGPVIVVAAELLDKIDELAGQAASLGVIENDPENEAAGHLLKLVTTLEKQVEEDAAAANKPFYQVSKAISEAKAKASKPLATIKSQLKAALGNYVVKRDRERLAAERLAAEQRAKEEAEVAMLNRQRAEEAKTQGVAAPAPLVVAPQTVMVKAGEAKADAIKVKRAQVVVIVDAANVPARYCVPSLELVEMAWKRGEITPELHTFFRVDEVVSVSAK